MAGKWPLKTIAECASNEPYSTQIGPFGKALTPEEYTETGVPLLRGVNVNHGRFHDDDYVFISEETADRLAKFESFPDDVLLVHKGTLGKIGLMPKERRFHRYIMGNSMLRVRCNRSVLLPEYLYYWLSSPFGTNYLLSRVSQVGVPQIQRPLTTLREATLPVPDLETQRSIVNTLGSLDGKIELNRRMNGVLEGMARAIFKAWFVDFEPVKAKAAGATSFPGIPQPTFDLLPTRLIDSELGEIPEGWVVGTLGEVMRHPRRAVQPEDVKAETPYVGLEHIPRHSIWLPHWGFAGSVTSNKHQFLKGEFLFGKLRPYFHKVCVAPVDGVCSTDVVVVSPASDNWRGFVLFHISSAAFIAYTTAASTGTKMPRTNWKDMSSYSVCLPSGTVAKAFSDLIDASLRLMIVSGRESQLLGATRDALLPKLISGELAVPSTKGGGDG